MRAAVIVFPGSNAETEMVRALALAGFSVETVWHKDTALSVGTDLVAIPGGFSYGDYLRSGALVKASPIVPALRAHAERGGFVLGVCNGFQILTELKLLPGALTRNQNLTFACKDVFVKVTGEGPFTPHVGQILRLPIAHAEGCYQTDRETFRRLEGEGDVALRYASKEGTVCEEANPNGSLGNVAGIYGGTRKNILGLMPHPERAAEALLGGADGASMFVSLRNRS